MIHLVNNILKGKIPTEETEDLFFSLESQNYKKFDGYIKRVACPVEISITNSNGDIIYGNVDTINEDEIREIFKNETNVNTLGTTTYFVFDEETGTELSNYGQVIIEAYDKGPTSVSIDTFKNGKIVQRNAFSTFSIDPSRKAIIDLSTDIEKSTLNIYKNGDVEQHNLHPQKIEFSEDKVVLPETSLEVTGKYLIKHSDTDYFAKKEIQIK
ncbi:hypothetical protein [Heyndrickxia ginsengihumi]|uniref:hypothetical protein n=1 Tax=Heyndrickxia ginsengihumi TaxID=363870 RepID=UPI000690D909|nr:hypothetical protein [Heyndrickxia ginsengihumi]